MSIEPPRVLAERDREEAMKLETLRRAIQIGLDQIEQGEVAPLDMDAIRTEVKARRARRRVDDRTSFLLDTGTASRAGKKEK